MTSILLVQGTWGGTWAREGTPFRQMLAAQHVTTLEPFEWSYDLSGVLTWMGRTHSDWIAGGAALTYYLRGLPYEQRNVIAHSHGGQVAAYAAAHSDCWIRRLITVSTPVRKDMQDTWAQARPNIGAWTHVAAKRGDWMIRLGELFDGAFGWTRQMPSADRNLIFPNIGHTGLFTDQQYFHHWPPLLDLLSDTYGVRRCPPTMR